VGIIITAIMMVVMLVIGVVGGVFATRWFAKRRMEDIDSLARRTQEEAKTRSATILKEAELKAKDRQLQLKMEFEKETKERRKELAGLEKRLVLKEENLDKKVDLLDRKETDISGRERTLVVREKAVALQEKKYDALIEEWQKRIENVAGMTAQEAKKQLISQMESEAKHEAAMGIKQIEDEAREMAEKQSKKIIALAIQRYAGEYVSERTVSVVNLPSDDMKGRIIGREGRNIRALEAATGIDFIVDDTPEAVILSGHNPVRREVARLSLEKLISDGRIHPGRIEEVVEKTATEVDKEIYQAGEQATFDVGVHGIHMELIRIIGRLKFRTSFAQNVLQHSIEVAFLTGIMAAELGINVKAARRAGLLHDIGKAVDHEVEGSHAAIGADLAKKYGENPQVIHAIVAHHEEVKPDTVLAVLVQAADALSGARPGARREMLETYVKRLEDLERIANSFEGIEKSYAIQAGREIRIIVEAEDIDDAQSAGMARDVAKKIESELSYPGQIKVTVIRETRTVEFAR
jgi:ribonuclease Y